MGASQSYPQGIRGLETAAGRQAEAEREGTAGLSMAQKRRCNDPNRTPSTRAQKNAKQNTAGGAAIFGLRGRPCNGLGPDGDASASHSPVLAPVSSGNLL